MIRNALPAVGVLAMSLAAFGPALAQSGGTEASFISQLSDCVETEVQVFVRSHAASAAANADRIDASVIELDHCNDQVLLHAHAQTRLGRGAFDSNPSRPRLDAEVRMVDEVSKNIIPIKFSLEWAEEGAPIAATTRRAIGDSRNQRLTLNRAVRRSISPAIASGTVSSDSKDFVAGATDDASIWH